MHPLISIKYFIHLIMDFVEVDSVILGWIHLVLLQLHLSAILLLVGPVDVVLL